MKLRSIATLLAFVSVASAARAGGLVRKLPADGSWTKFSVSMKQEGPLNSEISGSLSIRSVGSVTENGEKCRWIEIHSVGMANGKPQSGLMKLLVRERDFAAGVKTTPKVLRGWKQNNETGIEELTERDKAVNGTPMMFFGRTPLGGRALNREKVIDYQKGQLKIAAGITGKLPLNPAGGAAAKDIEFDTTQSVWTHSSVPFGTAAMELVLKASQNGNVNSTMTMKFTVQDFGTGAKSALPDKK